jgi:hypothetical protein
MEARMNQLTLRKVPVPVEKLLRAHARHNGQSINKAAVSLLSSALRVPGSGRTKRKRDLSRFVGTMTDAELRAFNRNIRAFGTIDKEMWNT